MIIDIFITFRFSVVFFSSRWAFGIVQDRDQIRRTVCQQEIIFQRRSASAIILTFEVAAEFVVNLVPGEH